MEIIFAKNYLKELYMEGKSSDKKHRYQKDIIKRYRKTIDRMADAKRAEDLMLINSLRYEKLVGLKSGISSGTDSLTICNIIELSNHYK